MNGMRYSARRLLEDVLLPAPEHASARMIGVILGSVPAMAFGSGQFRRGSGKFEAEVV